MHPFMLLRQWLHYQAITCRVQTVGVEPITHTLGEVVELKMTAKIVVMAAIVDRKVSKVG